MGVGDDGGRPVDQRPLFVVDEKVEGVEVTVADDACRGRVIGELSCERAEVVAPDGVRLEGDAVQECVDVAAFVVFVEVAESEAECDVSATDPERSELRAG